jgi:uncharacterized protein (DUF488 family)
MSYSEKPNVELSKRSPQDTKFYTIGYGGRKPEEFVSLLNSRGVRTVVDVRLRPRGFRGYYTRSQDPNKGIGRILAEGGVEYLWAQELGNPFMDQDGWAEEYQGHLDQLGGRLAEILENVPAPFCLMCSEKRVGECHRKLIADRLVETGARVEHIE